MRTFALLMDNNFEIPLTYRNKELVIPASLVVQGYTYRIEAELEGVLFYFERDDSGDFRAILPPDIPQQQKLPETGLIQAVTEALNQLLS